MANDGNIDIPVGSPGTSSGGDDGTTTGDDEMAVKAGEVDATIDKVLDQAFAKTHENWMGTMQHSADGHQVLNETGRWIFQGAASGQLFLASGILAQRSAQAQPQSTVHEKPTA
jgi:hypothetical protein